MTIKIQDLMRCATVKRWHTVNVARQQSIAEHQFMVAMIAREIAKRLDIDDVPIIKFAMEHDIDEILTGDPPSPAKKYINTILPYGGNNWPDDSLVYSVVKAADMIEAWFFITENGLGRHAKQCADGIYTDLAEFLTGMPDTVSCVIEEVMATIAVGEMLP